MKKQLTQISRIAYCFLTSVMIVGILSPDALSQPRNSGLPPLGKIIAKKTDVWYAAYTVTIKGEGVDEGEPGSGDSVATWTISRIYTGSIRLADGLAWADSSWPKEELIEALSSERKVRFGDPSPQVHVQIKDYVHRKGIDVCAQYNTTMETWDADVRGLSSPTGSASLTIDNKKLSHDTSFPTMLALDRRELDVKYQKDVFSFPAGTVEVGKPEYFPISPYRVPAIKDWLEYGYVARNNAYLLEDNGSYTYKSPELTVMESMLRGINTSGKVTVQITYNFMKQEK